MNKKNLSVILKIIISGSLLYFLFRGIDMDGFFKTVKAVDLKAVVFIGLLYLATQVTAAYRWFILLKNSVDIPYPKLLSIYFIGMFFNNFMPSMLGGDLAKGYYLYKISGKGGAAVASIFMDRYAGFTALMAITAVATVIGYPLVQETVVPLLLVSLIGAYIIGSLVLWVESFHGWALKILGKLKLFGLNEKIDSLYQSIMRYKGFYETLSKAFVLSLIIQSAVIISYYILAAGLGMSMPFGYFFLLIPLITAVAMLPISLAGLGIREGAFVFFFTKVGATQAQALSLSLLWFFVMVFINLIGGIEYIRLGSVNKVGSQKSGVRSQNPE
ncbi:MAG: flippase-like domain-containing protein [Deltaproteobacteria bacterium]|nr:flippase-like domain-containing protein [Deltaproteobacteria bacterium]